MLNKSVRPVNSLRRANSELKWQLLLTGPKQTLYHQSASLSSDNNVDRTVAKSRNLAEYARGTGGRSSFNGQVVTIFGSTGMIGRILANRFGKEGAQIICGYRGDPWDARSLKLVGDLGQVWFQEADIRDAEKIKRAVQYSNIVINCMGTDHETRNFSFDDVNCQAAGLVARVSRECGVERLIHFSALNASPTPPQIYFKPSQFLVSKFNGEQAVKQEFPDAVIIRPANVYGEVDRFLQYYTSEVRRGFSGIAMWNKGEMTIKMPVHQSDLADGIMKIANNREIKGVTYDFVGPERYLLSEIVDYIFHLMRRQVKRDFMTPTRIGFTYLMENILKRPKYSFDLLEREFISDSLSTDSKNPTLKDLGISFRKFDEMTAWHLKQYNKLSYFNTKLEEVEHVPAPKALSDDFEYQIRRKIRSSLQRSN
jgi:NADH dehydrogenase (ubiquinone) 1 alpha subcomplex subunit 9